MVLFTAVTEEGYSTTPDTGFGLTEYHVKVVREAGADGIGGGHSDYAEDHLRIHALTEQEAHQMADFICCLPFRGQKRRTFIEEAEHFDGRY